MSNMQELLKELMATNAKDSFFARYKNQPLRRHPVESWFPQQE